MKATKLLAIVCGMAFLTSCGGSSADSATAEGGEASAIDGAALASEYCECLQTKEALECAEMAINHTVDLAKDAEQLKAYEVAIGPCSEAAEAAALEKMEADMEAAMDELEDAIDEEMEMMEDEVAE